MVMCYARIEIFKKPWTLKNLLFLSAFLISSCTLDVRVFSLDSESPAAPGSNPGSGDPSALLGSFSVSGVTGGADITADAYLSSGLLASISWSASSAATSYDAAIYADDASTVICAVSTADTTYNFSACTLTAGTYYRAKVSAKLGSESLAASNNSYRFLVYPSVQLTATSQSVAESAGTMTITAQLNAAIEDDVTLSYGITGTATGGATDFDVQAGSGSPVTITAGQTTKNIVFTINDDGAVESSETVIITLSAATKANLGTNTVHTASIMDNDLALTVAKVYSTNGNWNDYVKFDNTGGGTNPYDQDDVACTGAETGYYGLINGCIHGGEKRKVTVTGYTSCTGLTITDALGAFDWTCKLDGGVATFYTIGLKEGKGLADLVGATSWNNNSVIVQLNAITIATSTSTTWGWSNTVTALPVNSAAPVIALDTVDDDGGGTDQAYASGTIFTLSADATTRGYNLNMDRASIVTLGSAKLTWSGTTTHSCGYPTGEVAGANNTTIVCAGAQKFLWIEGSYYGDSGSASNLNIYLEGMKYSRLNKVRTTKFYGWGFYIRNSNYNLIVDTAMFDAPNDYAFIDLNDCYYNRVTKVRLTHATLATPGNGGHGFVLKESSHNIVFDVQVSQLSANYPTTAIYTYFSNNITPVTNNRIVKAHVSGVGHKGIHVHSFAAIDEDQRHTFSHLTVTNAYQGLLLEAGTVGKGRTTVNQFVLGNIEHNNIWARTDFLKFSQGVIASSSGVSGVGIYSDGSNTSSFTNNMILGNIATLCDVTGTPTDPGLDNTCNNQGTSDATWRSGASYSLASSFIGKVTSNDTANLSDTNGSAAFGSITDWINFDFLTRAWGKDGGVFPSATNVGQCTAGTCSIWDWALRTTDTIIRNNSNDGSTQNAAFVAGATCPAAVHGNKTLTDQMTVANTFLINAVEIVTDEIGDEDGLCETGESCIYSPNFGYYQGEGNYLTAGSCTFQNGTVSGVTMYAYPTNGR